VSYIRFGTLKLWTGVLVALFGLTVSSCGGSGKTSSPPSSVRDLSSTTAATRTNGTTSTTLDPQATVDAAVLTISSFPAGWATDNALVQNTSDDKGFCDNPSSKTAAAVIAERRVAFAQDPNLGPIVQDWVILYGSSADASHVMAVTDDAASSCTTWSYKGHVATIDQLSVPTNGDEQHAYRVTVSGDALDFVLVRLGRAVLQVTALGLTSDELTQYVDKAIAKERAAVLG
jgi:hypothetical protein